MPHPNGIADLELVKSAARSLDILECLSNNTEGVTLTVLRQHLKIPISSLYKILMTMVQKGFVIRDELTLMYRLGPKIEQLAASFQNQVDLIKIADPYMNRLSRLTGETTSLTVLRDDVIVFIHKAVCDSNMQIVNPVGTTLAAHATGSGKVMLAYLPQEELDRIYPKEHLQRFTPNTITSKKQLFKLLTGEIAPRGYAFDNQESIAGVWATAACIRNRLGRPVAAISIVGLVGRIQNKDYGSWPQHVKETTAEISAILGYKP